MQKSHAKLAAVVLTVFVFVQASSAVAEKGYYFEYEAKIEGAAQTPAPRITKTWLTENKARFESNQAIIIERIDLGESYRLNPASKQYIIMPFLAEVSEGVKVFTEPLKTVKEVGGRKSKGLILTMEVPDGPAVVQRVFYSQDFGINADEFYRLAFSFPTLKMSLAPFKDLKAFVVLSYQDAPKEAPVETAGRHLVTELKVLEQRDIDDSVFSVPPDYVLEGNRPFRDSGPKK